MIILLLIINIIITNIIIIIIDSNTYYIITTGKENMSIQACTLIVWRHVVKVIELCWGAE